MSRAQLRLISTCGAWLSALIVTGCDFVPGTKEYAIKVGERRAAAQLLDPESAVFTGVVSYGAQHERVCGTINGRNRMGGYAEPVRFISTPSLTALGPNSSTELDDPVEACLFAAAEAFYWAEELGPAISKAGCSE